MHMFQVRSPGADPESIRLQATVNHNNASERHMGAALSFRDLCSRDRGRVYGHCSTTTARFLRVAVTTYFYTHDIRMRKSEGGEGEGGRIVRRGLSSSDAG